MKHSISLIIFTLITLNVAWSQKSLSEDLKKHVSILAADSLEGRGLGTKGSEKARRYITSEFEKAGLEKFGDSFLHPFDYRVNLAWVKAYNIIGYVEGTDPALKEEFIVIGGHYDHLGYFKRNDSIFPETIYNGADDNASGTAAVIELAHYFGKPENKTARSLIFICFDAEESGLIGSKHFVKNSPVPLDQIKLMFSLDMVGMLNTYGGLDLKGLGVVANGKKAVEPFASEEGVKLKDTSGEIERQTDTHSFGLKGIHAIHAFTGLVSPYHQPEDTYDLLEYEGMEKVVRFMQSTVSHFATIGKIERAKRVTKKNIKTGGKKPFYYFGLTTQQGVGSYNYIDEFYIAKRQYNPSLGIESQFRINSFLRLTNEVLADYNGTSAPEGNLRRLSLTAPIMLQLRTPDDQVASAFISVGGYYRHHFFARQNGENIPFENGFNQTEYGANFSIGIHVMKVKVAYTYRRALSDNRWNGMAIQDVNSLLSVSYFFRE